MLQLIKPAAQPLGKVALKAATSPQNIATCVKVATQTASFVGGVLVIPTIIKVGSTIASGVKKATPYIKTGAAFAKAYNPLRKKGKIETAE